MKRLATTLFQRCLRLTAVAGITCSIEAPLVRAQQAQQQDERPVPLEQRAQVTYDAYILGPGDGLQIELLDLPELSGRFSIGPDGTLYLPRLRALYVEGLTVEELRYFLTQQYGFYVRAPQVYVRPVAYRPIRVYVGGEVKRPWSYTLSGETNLSRLSETAEANRLQSGTAFDTGRPGHHALFQACRRAGHPQARPGPRWWPHPHQPRFPLPDHRRQRIPEHPPV